MNLFFVGELYQHQASSPVTSRAHQIYSSVTRATGYSLGKGTTIMQQLTAYMWAPFRHLVSWEAAPTPSWFDSSVGRTLLQYHRGYWFEYVSSLNCFKKERALSHGGKGLLKEGCIFSGAYSIKVDCWIEDSRVAKGKYVAWIYKDA